MRVSKTGDKVGYLVLSEHAGQWIDTDCPRMDTIGQAFRMLTDYQEEEPGVTFAVGRVELAMISRPHTPAHPTRTGTL
jgi:hypothetical protein